MKLLPGGVDQVEEILFAVVIVQHTRSLRFDGNPYTKVNAPYSIERGEPTSFSFDLEFIEDLLVVACCRDCPGDFE